MTFTSHIPAAQGLSSDAEDPIELPEDWIVPGTDIFDSLPPVLPFWHARTLTDLEGNMTMGAILMAHAIGRIDGEQAINAMVEHGLTTWDDLVWFMSVKARCSDIIEGDV